MRGPRLKLNLLFDFSRLLSHVYGTRQVGSWQLLTAGGLVFTGDRQGYLIAFDDRTGKVLWKFQAGGPIMAPPISYALEGKQYIEVAAGSSILTFTLK